MNEKIFIVCLLSFCFTGCCTRGEIYNHGVGAYEVRENLGKLGEEQTQSAVTSAELKSEIDRNVELVGELDKFIENGAGDLNEFKAILRGIRERGARHINTK